MSYFIFMLPGHKPVYNQLGWSGTAMGTNSAPFLAWLSISHSIRITSESSSLLVTLLKSLSLCSFYRIIEI